MQILSHRGFWKESPEKNTTEAFIRSFQSGFGTETDIRDLAGQVVISHDPPRQSHLTCEQFFECHSQYGVELPLALNVKADGLQQEVLEMTGRHDIKNYFVFDMSIPDTLGYKRLNIPYFTRQSEHEPEPALYDDAVGVWLDCFEREWYDTPCLMDHFKNGKRVCIVSPELHQRNHVDLWHRLRSLAANAGDRLMLCTDLPDEARRFFHGEN